MILQHAGQHTASSCERQRNGKRENDGTNGGKGLSIWIDALSGSSLILCANSVLSLSFIIFLCISFIFRLGHLKHIERTPPGESPPQTNLEAILRTLNQYIYSF